MGTTTHEKKVALVTGANKGIGLLIRRQLGGHGFTVVLAARDEARDATAAARLRSVSLVAHGVVLDVTGPATTGAAGWIDGQLVRLDVLVNSAGMFPESLSAGMPSDLTLKMLRQT